MICQSTTPNPVDCSCHCYCDFVIDIIKNICVNNIYYSSLFFDLFDMFFRIIFKCLLHVNKNSIDIEI